MGRPVNYPGLKELEGEFFYREIPSRLSQISKADVGRIVHRVTCAKGGVLEYEGVPTKVWAQRVFRCHLHNDTLILPQGYQWRFLRVINEGEPVRQFMPLWDKFHRRYSPLFTLRD